MLIAHISDTHLGYRQYGLKEREEDFYKAFEQCIDKILDYGCDAVIHTGDLFEKNNPSNRARLFVKEQFKKLLENGIKIFIIPGNHDNPTSRYDPYPPHILYEVNVLSIKNFCFKFKDVLIFGLPYFPKVYKKNLKIYLKQIENINSKRKTYRSILMLHQIIDKYFPYEYELSVKDLPKGFDYYAMGHLHRNIIDHIDNSILCYPGSIETYRIDEANFDKGFYLVDLDSMNVKRINIKTRKFFVERIKIYTNEDMQKTVQRLIRIKPYVKDSIVHITLETSELSYRYVVDRISKLLNECFYLKIEKDILKETYRKKEQKVKGIKDMLKEFLYDLSEEDLNFVENLLRYLGSGDIEAAEKLVEDFYRNKFKKNV